MIDRNRREIFADTSGVFAVLYNRDQDHEAARAALHGITVQRLGLVTTDLVIAEIHALTYTRLGVAAGLSILTTIFSDYRIVWTTQDDFREGRAILERYRDKDFSLADAVSFAVIERYGITRAFTFDHHFAQYGFLTVPARSRP